MSTPFRVDLHTHILPPRLPDVRERFGYGGFVTLEPAEGGARMMVDGSLFRDVPATTFDASRRLEECDRKGVAVQVLSTVPVMFCYWAEGDHALEVARLLNDHIAETVSARPRRFAGLGTVPLQDPDLAIAEMERCVGELGLAGMKRYWTPWLVGMPAELSLAFCSLTMGGVLERLPGLRLAFAHGGGSFPFTLGRIDHGYRARPDLCAIDSPKPPGASLDRLVVDSLVHDPEALRFLVRLLGPERIALGSDYPFPLGEDQPGRLIESLAELPAAARERMLAGTALEFLGRRREDFA